MSMLVMPAQAVYVQKTYSISTERVVNVSGSTAQHKKARCRKPKVALRVLFSALYLKLGKNALNAH